MVWVNNDGLVVKFGTEEGDRGTGGEVRALHNGSETIYEFDIRWNDLEAFGTTTFLSDVVRIPGSSCVRALCLRPYGHGRDSDFGLYDTDRTTAYDADGIDATIANCY
jgi:hypothetical protein